MTAHVNVIIFKVFTNSTAFSMHKFFFRLLAVAMVTTRYDHNRKLLDRVISILLYQMSCTDIYGQYQN